MWNEYLLVVFSNVYAKLISSFGAKTPSSILGQTSAVVRVIELSSCITLLDKCICSSKIKPQNIAILLCLKLKIEGYAIWFQYYDNISK